MTREHTIHEDSSDAVDRALVERAVDGSRDALRELVERHQPFIFNLALKMFGARADAEDLTQEVLVKVITSLRTFEHRSSLRTWLYRITTNHFLKTRRRAVELVVDDFERYFDNVAAAFDAEPDPLLGITDDTVEEVRIRCTTGMLMCLDREQRITFLLGAVFGVHHDVAAEILGVSPANYRVRLHRARRDLGSWMDARCGLVDARNSCRCRKKTTTFVRSGLVDPKRLVWNADYVTRIDGLARRDAPAAMEKVDELHDKVFTSHPLVELRTAIVESVLGDPTLKTFFALGDE